MGGLLLRKDDRKGRIPWTQPVRRTSYNIDRELYLSSSSSLVHSHVGHRTAAGDVPGRNFLFQMCRFDRWLLFRLPWLQNRCRGIPYGNRRYYPSMHSFPSVSPAFTRHPNQATTSCSKYSSSVVLPHRALRQSDSHCRCRCHHLHQNNEAESRDSRRWKHHHQWAASGTSYQDDAKESRAVRLIADASAATS